MKPTDAAYQRGMNTERLNRLSTLASKSWARIRAKGPKKKTSNLHHLGEGKNPIMETDYSKKRGSVILPTDFPSGFFNPFLQLHLRLKAKLLKGRGKKAKTYDHKSSDSYF